MSQAEILVCAIRRKAMTYGDLEALRVSTCPWKRLSESGYMHLKPGEVIVRKVGKDGLVRIGITNLGDQGCYFQNAGARDRKAVNGRG